MMMAGAVGTRGGPVGIKQTINGRERERRKQIELCLIVVRQRGRENVGSVDRKDTYDRGVQINKIKLNTEISYFVIYIFKQY